jgi:hypothetical protein
LRQTQSKDLRLFVFAVILSEAAHGFIVSG